MPTAVADPEAIPGQTTVSDQLAKQRDGEVARLNRAAEKKIEQAEKLEDDDDPEGADIARIEATDLQQKAAALRTKGGAAVDPPRDPEADAEKAQKDDQASSDLAPEEIIVAGIEMPYINVGGKKATHGSLKLSGGKILLQAGTAFKKGTTIEFSGKAVIKDVGVVDTHDPTTRQVTDAEQRHVARIVDLQVEVPE